MNIDVDYFIKSNIKNTWINLISGLYSNELFVLILVYIPYHI